MKKWTFRFKYKIPVQKKFQPWKPEVEFTDEMFNTITENWVLLKHLWNWELWGRYSKGSCSIWTGISPKKEALIEMESWITKTKSLKKLEWV